MKNIVITSILSVGLLFSGLSMSSSNASSKKDLEAKVAEQELQIRHLEERMIKTEETVNQLLTTTENLTEENNRVRDELSYLYNRYDYLKGHIDQLATTVYEEYTIFTDVPANDISSTFLNHIQTLNQEAENNCLNPEQCEKENVDIKVIFKSNSFNYEELISADEINSQIQAVLDENRDELNYIHVESVSIKIQYGEFFVYEMRL